jgi:hypothetical protein
MAVRKLEKSEWQGYFDRMSKALVGKRAEIEVVSLDLGDQIEAEWVPLLGIVYEPKENVLEIAIEGLDDLIREPREIHVDEDAGGLIRFETVDGAGVRHILQLRDPLMLPAPSSTR